MIANQFQQFKPGDYIYYHHRNGDTYPGRVLSIGKAVRVTYNGLTGDVKASVSATRLAKQSEV